MNPVSLDNRYFPLWHDDIYIHTVYVYSILNTIYFRRPRHWLHFFLFLFYSRGGKNKFSRCPRPGNERPLRLGVQGASREGAARARGEFRQGCRAWVAGNGDQEGQELLLRQPAGICGQTVHERGTSISFLCLLRVRTAPIGLIEWE